MTEYIAGKTNIGYKNRFARLITGLTVIVIVLILWTIMNIRGMFIGKLSLFLPVFMAVLLLVEAIYGFDVLKARKGKYDLR